MSNQQLQIRSRINQLSLYIVLINCTLGLFVYLFLARSLLLLAGIVTETLLALIPIYLNHRGYHKRAAFVLYIILAAASFFFSSMIGNATIANLMGAVLVASGGYFFSHRKSRTWSYLIAILVVWGVQENHVIALIPEINLEQPNYSRLLLLAYGVVVSLVFTLVGWYRRSSLTWSEAEQQTDLDVVPDMVVHGPVNVRSIFKEAEDVYQGWAHVRGVSLVCNVSLRFPETIQADERLLRSIVAQLLKNAIEFSPNGTAVTARAYMNGFHMIIAVEAKRLDIALNTNNRLFKPGTGLYFIRRLVLALDGHFGISKIGTDGVMLTVTWMPPKASPLYTSEGK
ncbi:MAG TPA: hypothetical protein VG605_19680 [Puia sp.]|nr:hypothetical protein [Puia sp.]